MCKTVFSVSIPTSHDVFNLSVQPPPPSAHQSPGVNCYTADSLNNHSVYKCILYHYYYTRWSGDFSVHESYTQQVRGGSVRG